ncbi:CoA-binding protein [Jeotgalibacillus proteolyticus]|uniref:CoA-binding protein n=1 Tax=Jeotgalibacillus proteolyticus TaxID=2082395 RepID=A0A2S5GG13_9BACL|nr:CoA-binding protein [Jeotgalibacillus proteolyticus]PPA71936.1 CoA-binding protein [Jeotgalibacillus proteolyticus]
MIENPSRENIGALLKQAKTIAVIGLSDNPSRTSYGVSKAMQDAGYKIIPVNPTIKEALGVKAVSSLKEIEEKIDIVNVFRRSEFLPELAEEFLQTDAPIFWTQLGVVDEEVFNNLSGQERTVIMDRCIKVEHSLSPL